jgi:hypothetical protein
MSRGARRVGPRHPRTSWFPGHALSRGYIRMRGSAVASPDGRTRDPSPPRRDQPPAGLLDHRPRRFFGTGSRTFPGQGLAVRRRRNVDHREATEPDRRALVASASISCTPGNASAKLKNVVPPRSKGSAKALGWAGAADQASRDQPESITGPAEAPTQDIVTNAPQDLPAPDDCFQGAYKRTDGTRTAALRQCEDEVNGAPRGPDGRFLPNQNRSPKTPADGTHGNARASTRPTVFYRLWKVGDDSDYFLKRGITSELVPTRRCNKKGFWDDKRMEIVAGGSRSDMTDAETFFVSRWPGPDNDEKHRGSLPPFSPGPFDGRD